MTNNTKLTLTMICREMLVLVMRTSATGIPPKLAQIDSIYMSGELSRVHVRTADDPDCTLDLETFGQRYLATIAQILQRVLREAGLIETYDLPLLGYDCCVERFAGLSIRAIGVYDIKSDKRWIVFEVAYRVVPTKA